jgi:hypothetical protein
MSYPSIIIHSCSETVNNASFVDITFATASFPNIPQITAIAEGNVNVFVSNITLSSARLNFSAVYTGEVKYTAMTVRL